MTPLLSPTELLPLMQTIQQSRRIVVCAHRGPDGDAVGSSLGWAEYLTALGKQVSVVLPNPFPDFLRFLPGSHLVHFYLRHEREATRIINEADLICCLDFNGLKRIDDLALPVSKSKAKKIMIDHHLDPEGFCDVTLSRPESSSTCELLFRLLDSIGDLQSVNFHCAEDIYAGMCTDTGGFTYNSNDPDIFLIISELMRKGIDKDLIYRRINNNYTESRFRLMGFILYHKLEVFPQTHSSIFSMTKEELKRFHYLKGDAEGIVNMPLCIKGQKLSISLREDTERPIIWVSLRSVDDFPCNKMAEDYFNGGGHLNAAGGKLLCPMEDAIEVAKRAIEGYKDLLMDSPAPRQGDAEKA